MREWRISDNPVKPLSLPSTEDTERSIEPYFLVEKINMKAGRLSPPLVSGMLDQQSLRPSDRVMTAAGASQVSATSS